VNDVSFPENCVSISALSFSFLHKNFSLIDMTMMNTTEEKGNWNKQKGELIQKYASLTKNDQLFQEGEKQKIFGKEQIRLGKTEEELHRINLE